MTESMPSTPAAHSTPAFDENRLIAERRSKLGKLRVEGLAYPNDFRPDSVSADLHEAYDALDQEAVAEAGRHVKVAGRMMLKRVMGKASFASLQDGAGRIQIYLDRASLGEDLYANLTLTSTVQDSAKLWARGHFNLAKSFDVDAKLERVNLALFNPLFKAYGPFDVEKGSLTIDAELANNGKNLKGYVKPIIKDLNVIELKERYEKADQTGTEIVVGVGLYLLKNSKSRSAGTVLEIKGSLADPQLDYWGAIWTAVKNSVGEPDVKPGLENRKLRK